MQKKKKSNWKRTAKALIISDKIYPFHFYQKLGNKFVKKNYW